MGAKERREREKQQLRRKILEAAQKIIHQEGFAALSMRKLADRIEYSPASLYTHFSSREEIARELAQVGFTDLLHVMIAASSAEPDPSKRLKDVMLAYIAFGMQHPETYRLIFMSDSAYTSAAFAEQSSDSAANQCFSLLVDIAAELQQRDLVSRSATPAELAEVVWTAAHGVVSLPLTCTEFRGMPTERLSEILANALVEGLRR